MAEPLLSPNKENQDTTAALCGSCSCRQVSYTSTRLPSAITLCHCKECRRTSGAPFLAWAKFQNSNLRWSSAHRSHKSGEEKAARKGKGEGGASTPIRLARSTLAVRGFCGQCGTPLFMRYHCSPDETSVAMGTVEDEGVQGTLPKPAQHIFLREKATWWDVPGDEEGATVARYDGFSEPFQKRLEEWDKEGRPQRAGAPLLTES